MNNRTGISFAHRGRCFKLADIEWGKDNSFYILPHQHDEEVGERLVTETDSDGHLVLSIDEVKAGCFPVKKISRHTSGIYHIKDVSGKGGSREKDGLKGPSFKDADGFFTFLVICPQAIDTLVEVASPDPTHIKIDFTEPIAPFTVQIAVWDKNRQVTLRDPQGTFLGPPISLSMDDYDHGLMFMFPKVIVPPGTPARFPVRTCYIIQ